MARWDAAAAARIRTALRAVRDDWTRIGRWVLARRLVLPAVLGWTMATDVAGRPLLLVEAALVLVALLARFTLPAFALLLVVALVTAPPAVVVAIPVIAHAAGRRIAAPRRAVLVFAVASVVVGLNVALRAAVLQWELAVALAVAAVGVGLVLPGAVGALVGERARRTEALHERNAILERAHRLGDEQTRMQERARIAGEMHDLLGHRLSLISLHAGAMELGTRQAAPELSEQAALVRNTARTALDELRAVLGILKLDAPNAGTDGHGDDAGTRADVSALVLASERAGLPVGFDWTGDDLTGADGPIRRAVHRVVREALTNVHKHAPGAPTRVAVERGAASVRIEVRNDLPAHRPRPAPGTSLGLVGLRERVRLVGGTIHAGTGIDGRAFVVVAVLPLVPAVSPPDGPDGPGGADTAVWGGWPATGERTARRPARTVLYAVLGVAVICCVGSVVGQLIFVWQAEKSAVSPGIYRSAQPGQPEDQVRGAVGEQGLFARYLLSGEEPPVPAGATCLYALSTAQGVDGPRPVYRFCFRDGKLVEKREIEGPG